MITGKVVIEYDQDYPHIHLVFASDQHIGSAEADINKYRSFLETNLSVPNSYLITVGDGIDCITTRDKRFQIGGIDPNLLHKAHNPDELLDLQTDLFIEIHRPYRQQIIGLGEGNHEHNVLKMYNTNVHNRICRALGVKNLGYHFILNLVLRPRGINGRSRTFRLMGHHGFGGASRTEGGPLTVYSNFAKHYNVDAAVMGHKHDFLYKRISRVSTNKQGKMEYRDCILALTGTFKKTFNQSHVPGWEETMGFIPRYLRGGWNLRLTPEKNGWIQTKVSEG